MAQSSPVFAKFRRLDSVIKIERFDLRCLPSQLFEISPMKRNPPTSFESCPVGLTQVNEITVRIGATVVALIMATYLLFGSPLLPSLLAIDFWMRSFGNARLSVVRWLADTIRKSFQANGKLVNAEPKRFAAGIGLQMCLLITILHLVGLSTPAKVFAAILICFALLEAIANVCVGCKVYFVWISIFSRLKRTN